MLRCAEWLCDALLRSGADRAEVMSTDGNPVVYAGTTADPAAPTVLVIRSLRYHARRSCR
ncbi:MAG: hypothetical protein ACLR8Y_03080 [Alistipes indistinctus]